jgi:hypothetical protein
MSNLREQLEKIYDDVEQIFNSKPVYVLGENIGRTSKVTDEHLSELNKYVIQFNGEENLGKLRTLLVILKPYKNHPIIKDTAELLANQLRSKSKTGFI